MSVSIERAPVLPSGAGTRKLGPEKWGLRLSSVHAALYRLHLGWLVGSDFILITHRGRKTGQVRQTVALIVSRDPNTHEAVVAAWSSNADWYRNVQASPALEVQIGSRKCRPEQRFLTAEELAEAIARNRRKHPVRSGIQRFLLGWPRGSSKEDLLALARSLGGVAFRPCGPAYQG